MRRKWVETEIKKDYSIKFSKMHWKYANVGKNPRFFNPPSRERMKKIFLEFLIIFKN